MTSRRTRVYLVSALPPPLGGVTVWTKAFVEAAPRYDLDVRLRRIGPKSDDEILRLGSRIARAGRGLVLPQLDILFGARGCDVVHVTASSGSSCVRGLSIVQAAVLRGLPAVLHMHASMTATPRPVLAWLDRLARLRNVRVVTPSHEDAAGNGQYTLVDNFVSRAFTHGPRWQGPSSGPGLRLLYAGWLIREKGLFELVDAVERVPNVTVDMVGPDIRPADKRALVERIATLGLEGRVTLRPAVPHAELPALMATYDALVLPSHAESFGLVTAEAMSVGLPVVGTRVGFLWDMRDEDFAPIRARDASDLGRVLRELGARKAELLPGLSQRARAYAHDRVSEDAVLSRWSGLYEELAATRAVAR